MSPPRRNLTASQAAAYLGVSAKALRIYEQQGLIAPERSPAGWRLYAADDVTRAAEVLALRALGLSLGQIARVLRGDQTDLDAGLAAQEDRLRAQAKQIATVLQQIRGMRDAIAEGGLVDAGDIGLALDPDDGLSVGFELPWPWGGEWFELRAIRPLNFITGPLGSGKTRFSERLAEALPDAAFIGLDRMCDETIPQRLAVDAALAARVARTLQWLEEDGAERSNALDALVVALEANQPPVLVVDMVEEGLSSASQRALVAHLRASTPCKRALFLMTRSSSILDLDLVAADEAIIYCPANHSPPFRVVPYAGGQGHEAVATCLAKPEIRAQTAGVIAVRPVTA